MFLIQASLGADDNGALALFAKDYYFATLWHGGPQEHGMDNDCGIGSTFDHIDEAQEPILC